MISPRSIVRSSTAALVAGSLILAACGGGSDDQATSPTTAESAGDVDDSADAESDENSSSGDDGVSAEPTEEGARPTQEDLCEIVGEVRDQLAVTIGLTAVEDELGTVLFGDCAVESQSVGYISLSLFPAIAGDASEAAQGIDGELTTPEDLGSSRLTDAFLVTGTGGLTQHAVFEEGGNVYLVQVESDTDTTPIGAAIETAAILRAVIAAR